MRDADGRARHAQRPGIATGRVAACNRGFSSKCLPQKSPSSIIGRKAPLSNRHRPFKL
jgi:hypothetical protein